MPEPDGFIPSEGRSICWRVTWGYAFLHASIEGVHLSGNYADFRRTYGEPRAY